MPSAGEDARLANLCCGHVACQREVRDLLAEAWRQGWIVGNRWAFSDADADAIETNPYITPPAEHTLQGAACSCGGWEAKLGESIHRGFDRHLLEEGRDA